MLEDPKIDAINKPRIRIHSDHVLEDAKDYEWEQVREWSEDTFTLLSQKVVPLWDDQFESQNQHHRSSTSHDKAGRLNNTMSGSGHTRATKSKLYQVTTRSARDRSDICCPSFNTTHGCGQQDQHKSGNLTYGHHCEYCRSVLELIHFHSTTDCRIKKRRETEGRNPPTSNQPFRA